MKLNTKRAALLGATLAIGAGALVASPASPVSAADGDKIIDINFNGTAPGAPLAIAQAGATTDFGAATTALGDQYGLNTMYDEGRYVIGTNPANYHVAWVNAPTADPQLILNGFTNSTDQTVFAITAQGEVCTTPGSNITYSFSANMANVLPLSYASDGGAQISVYINNTLIGSEQVLTNDPANLAEITGPVLADPNGTYVLRVVNSSNILVGNDFALDDITLTQNGDCEPPCEATTDGVWHNYTGKYSGGNLVPPALNDPQWHALPAKPGGEHDLAVRGFDKPYNPGAAKGKGDWFVWKDLGTTCPS